MRGPGESEFRVADLTTETELWLPLKRVGKYSFYVAPVSGAFEGRSSKKVSINVESKYRALVVTNEYSGSNYLPESKNNRKAVSLLLKRLGQIRQKWIVNEAQNAEAGQILSAISDTFSGSGPDDVCLFYFGGIAVTASGSDTGALYGNSMNTKITTAQLANALNSACGGKVIVLLDASGSGAAIDNSARQPSSLRFLEAVSHAFSAGGKSAASKSGELIGKKPQPEHRRR